MAKLGGPAGSGLTGEEGLIRVEGCVNVGSEGSVLADPRDDGTHDDGGLDNESAHSVGCDHDSIDADEEFADADPASVVDIEDYRLCFHT